MITFVDKQRSASTITHASNTQTVAKDAVTVLCMFYLFSFLVCLVFGGEGGGGDGVFRGELVRQNCCL